MIGQDTIKVQVEGFADTSAAHGGIVIEDRGRQVRKHSKAGKKIRAEEPFSFLTIEA
jgi:hypothetical protein